ncbi:MAG: hypothetical protein C0604_01050 [Clostridiales bacterium]|nr:MAG: hypothetical protein C0604_01050 [Clostridiales bacterium]
MNKGNEIIEELKTVLTGKTLDALVPPIVFIFANGLYGINWASILAICSAVLIGIARLVLRQTWKYAFGGLIGVSVAAGFSYIAGNAANYYIPKIIGSVSFIVAAGTSLIIKKPLAAWVSHLSRGWDLNWFWRSDVRPAYTEVTIFWTLFFALRLFIQLFLFLRGDVAGLFLVNTILSMPANVIVLVLSYIYGIWRLRSLGGPGVEEFEKDVEPPWKGQTRGF